MTCTSFARLVAPVALLGLVAGCAGTIAESPIQQPWLAFQPSAMDGPLLCLGQHIADRNAPPFTNRVIRKMGLRVGQFQDRSGKTTGTVPSDNPQILQAFFQGAVVQSGLFDIRTIDRGGLAGDLPIPVGRRGHAPTDAPAPLLLTGMLSGDTDYTSENADLQISVGPFRLFSSGRRRKIAQRVYAELVDAPTASLITTTVRDPRTGQDRRVHLALSVDIYVPETSFDFGAGGSFGGNDIAGGGGFDAELNRPKALDLAAKAIWFELLRRLTNSYAAADACLSEAAREQVRLPAEIGGLVFRNRPARRTRPMSEVGNEAVERDRRARATAHRPAPRRPVAPAPEPAAPRQAQPTPVPAIPAPMLAELRLPGGGIRSLRLVAPGPDARQLSAMLPEALTQVHGQDLGGVLYTAARETLEQPGVDAPVTVTLGGVRINLAAGPVERERLSGTTTYCRRLSVDGPQSHARIRACRDRNRPVWRFAPSRNA